MKEAPFNKLEFNKLIKLMNRNPKLALSKFCDYLNRYPKDYLAYLFYAGTLISLGYASEAGKVIEEAESLANGDHNFKYNVDSYSLFEYNLVYTKMKLYAYLENFYEVLKLYKDNFILFANNGISFHLLSFYCKKKLGFPVKNLNIGNSNYVYSLIECYDEDAFLEHVKRHLADYNVDALNPNKSLFAPDFPFMKVLEEVKKHIPSSKGLFLGFLDDTYVFRYDDCGRNNGRITNYFKVVTFHNTCDIITMYATNELENCDYIDLNYMKKENQEIERASMIERFYNRYKGQNII